MKQSERAVQSHTQTERRTKCYREIRVRGSLLLHIGAVRRLKEYDASDRKSLSAGIRLRAIVGKEARDRHLAVQLQVVDECADTSYILGKLL